MPSDVLQKPDSATIEELKDKERMRLIKESGCIATLLATSRFTQPPDVHHLTDCGRRLGDRYTIGLSPWHHRGLKQANMDAQYMMGRLGPSLAHGRREFEHRFGSQREVLLEVQDLILSEFLKNPWYNYAIPYEVRRMANRLWIERKEKWLHR